MPSTLVRHKQLANLLVALPSILIPLGCVSCDSVESGRWWLGASAKSVILQIPYGSVICALTNYHATITALQQRHNQWQKSHISPPRRTGRQRKADKRKSAII